MSRRKWVTENCDSPWEKAIWNGPWRRPQSSEPISLESYYKTLTPDALDVLKHTGKGSRTKEEWASISEEERERRSFSNSLGQKKWWASHTFEEKQARIRGALKAQDRVFSTVPILEGLPTQVLGWLTGFWEGDGGIDTKDRNTTVRFYQKDTDILDKIKDLVGGGCINTGGGYMSYSSLGLKGLFLLLKYLRIQ